ncbi:hypothetical protein [Shewanella sp.]|uniref:hypothetical protein n=1 Tax=Shewanella sp. TaxID=50422 RepID=UPI0040541B39
MSSFTIAMQDSADDVRRRINAQGRAIWFSFLNPMSRTCLLVKNDDVGFFKKCVAFSLLPSLFLAGIGAFFSLKNNASKEIELLVSIPILLSFVVIVLAYLRTRAKSEIVRLDYRPFVEIAKRLALTMALKDLLKSLTLMAGFALAIFIGALVIYAKGFYLIAVINLTFVGISLSPVSLLLIALVKKFNEQLMI